MAEEYEDELVVANSTQVISKGPGAAIDSKYKDLLMSELFELKNLWFLYNKKINSMLVILP
jgi:hypothetical protein